MKSSGMMGSEPKYDNRANSNTEVYDNEQNKTIHQHSKLLMPYSISISIWLL